jgi:hypothetical protein
LQPTGSLPELANLQTLLNEVESEIRSEKWRQKKTALFAEMAHAEFWSSSERFSVLGLLETIDRVEKGLDRAHALHARLEGHASKEKLPRRLIAMLAQTAYLLNAACDDVLQDLPREAFLLVEAPSEGRPDAASAVSFAHQTADMGHRLDKRAKPKRRCGSGFERAKLFLLTFLAAHFVLSDTDLKPVAIRLCGR